jgi:hypothetical protein
VKALVDATPISMPGAGQEGQITLTHQELLSTLAMTRLATNSSGAAKRRADERIRGLATLGYGHQQVPGRATRRR